MSSLRQLPHKIQLICYAGVPNSYSLQFWSQRFPTKVWSREAVAKIGCRWRCSWERARRARWQRALEHCACMEVTSNSSNMHGGNMHLCNVHSGNVQQSTCIACNVRLGCMRHLHGTASRWTRARIAVQSSCTVATLQPASTDLAKKRRHCTRCAAAYLRPRSQMCSLLQSFTEAIIWVQKLICWGCCEREI